MYNFNLKATTQILSKLQNGTFSDTLMPHLISFGVNLISLNPKNDNLTLYPVILIHAVIQTILPAAILKTLPFPPDIGHI